MTPIGRKPVTFFLKHPIFPAKSQTEQTKRGLQIVNLRCQCSLCLEGSIFLHCKIFLFCLRKTVVRKELSGVISDLESAKEKNHGLRTEA